MKTCYLCQKTSVVKLIDFGKQPVSHRFLSSKEEDEYLGPIVLGQCQNCALLQQLTPMPVEQLTARYDWLTRSEPEKHLDDLVQTLTKLPGINKDADIWGVCWKEDSTLARFNKLGYGNTYRLQIDKDFGVEDHLADVEIVQDRLTFKKSQEIVSRLGRADMVIARHLIEHAHDVREFLKVIKNFLKPNGYLVLEIPDCRLSMEHLDYTTIWEEHILYFTPATFRSCFDYGGFKLVDFIEEEYSLENSYIGIARIADQPTHPTLHAQTLHEELKRGNRFADQFEVRRQEIRAYLEDFKKSYGKIAIFGAAHMSSAFINLMDLKDCIEFIVDDNPHKNGMFMPGSHLPIRGSSAILEKDIKLCLLTLAVASEEKVLANNREFISKGGMFKSIFPRNPNALTVEELNGKY